MWTPMFCCPSCHHCNNAFSFPLLHMAFDFHGSKLYRGTCTNGYRISIGSRITYCPYLCLGLFSIIGCCFHQCQERSWSSFLLLTVSHWSSHLAQEGSSIFALHHPPLAFLLGSLEGTRKGNWWVGHRHFCSNSYRLPPMDMLLKPSSWSLHAAIILLPRFALQWKFVALSSLYLRRCIVGNPCPSPPLHVSC